MWARYQVLRKISWGRSKHEVSWLYSDSKVAAGSVMIKLDDIAPESCRADTQSQEAQTPPCRTEQGRSG